MPLGPGKYDDVTTAILLDLEASGVLVGVIGGKRGSGFSISLASPSMAPVVVSVLRSIADELEGTQSQLESLESGQDTVQE